MSKRRRGEKQSTYSYSASDVFHSESRRFQDNKSEQTCLNCYAVRTFHDLVLSFLLNFSVSFFTAILSLILSFLPFHYSFLDLPPTTLPVRILSNRILKKKKQAPKWVLNAQLTNFGACFFLRKHKSLSYSIIFQNLCNLKIYYRVQNSPLLVLIMSHVKSIHSTLPYFIKISFNITLPPSQ